MASPLAVSRTWRLCWTPSSRLSKVISSPWPTPAVSSVVSKLTSSATIVTASLAPVDGDSVDTGSVLRSASLSLPPHAAAAKAAASTGTATNGWARIGVTSRGILRVPGPDPPAQRTACERPVGRGWWAARSGGGPVSVGRQHGDRAVDGEQAAHVGGAGELVEIAGVAGVVDGGLTFEQPGFDAVAPGVGPVVSVGAPGGVAGGEVECGRLEAHRPRAFQAVHEHVGAAGGAGAAGAVLQPG